MATEISLQQTNTQSTEDDGPNYHEKDDESPFNSCDLSGELTDVPLDDHTMGIIEDEEAMVIMGSVMRMIRMMGTKGERLACFTKSDFALSVAIRLERQVELLLKQIKVEAVRYDKKELVKLITDTEKEFNF